MKLRERSNKLEIRNKGLELGKKFPNCLRKSGVSFWVDSSGGPKEYCNLSFYGVDPKYYFYGSLNEVYFQDSWIRKFNVNCFDFLERKINGEKQNKNGIFVGYISYNLFSAIGKPQATIHCYPDFFFAYFDKCHSRESGNLDKINCERRDLDSHFHGNDTLCSNMTDSEYLEKVRLIKEEIKKGNVYQVNLTREYSLELHNVNELELYWCLREISPNPYSCFFKTPFVTILSSSPEEFLYVEPIGEHKVSWAHSYIRTRPIKGTLPKGVFDVDDKNKAENIMIVDLERNDLGRICMPGTIEAKKLLNVEEYKHLNHVVSTVEGKLKENISLREIFEAIFPGGSITGAPKIAAMKIIDKQEPTKRGAYTGSFGYIKTDGTMNFNILIRTIFIQPNLSLRTKQSNLDRDCFVTGVPRNDTFRVTFNVGGGIVADSDPYDELEEIKLKSKGIISALGNVNLFKWSDYKRRRWKN